MFCRLQVGHLLSSWLPVFNGHALSGEFTVSYNDHMNLANRIKSMTDCQVLESGCCLIFSRAESFTCQVFGN